MRAFLSVFLLSLAAAHAAADTARPRQLASQLQLDLGLTVIDVAYEHPIGAHVAVQVEAGAMGTYFLPWFDLGDEVIGVGGGIRPTWFARESGTGLYVAPYLRVARVWGDDEAGAHGTGILVTSGVFAGWAFTVTQQLDLRLGLGAQYIKVDAAPLAASTPFVALDLVVGYRL